MHILDPPTSTHPFSCSKDVYVVSCMFGSLHRSKCCHLSCKIYIVMDEIDLLVSKKKKKQVLKFVAPLT